MVGVIRTMDGEEDVKEGEGDGIEILCTAEWRIEILIMEVQIQNDSKTMNIFQTKP